jgi:cell division protein ZapA
MADEARGRPRASEFDEARGRPRASSFDQARGRPGATDFDEAVRVVVDIFGEECALRGDGTPERLRGLAALVDARMRAVAARSPRLSKTRVAMLAALQLADELGRLQEVLVTRVEPAAAEERPLPAPAPAPAPPPRRITHRPRA